MELNVGPANAGVVPEVSSLGYLNSRFVTPKKFRNEFTAGVGSGITVMFELYATGLVL